MTSFFDGHIANIKPEVVEDLDTIIAYLDENPGDEITEKVARALVRASDYLDAYKANETKDE